jgi:hypothetical protein
MNPQDFIPAIDPNPLPAPYWIFKLLLIVTFILHIVVMNFMFGGGFLAALARFRSKKDENYARLFKALAKKIPNLLPATITLGVAPLLFLQVIYGQFFYTSTIIIVCGFDPANPSLLWILLYLIQVGKKCNSHQLGVTIQCDFCIYHWFYLQQQYNAFNDARKMVNKIFLRSPGIQFKLGRSNALSPIFAFLHCIIGSGGTINLRHWFVPLEK